jgi:hypothetical protein
MKLRRACSRNAASRSGVAVAGTKANTILALLDQPVLLDPLRPVELELVDQAVGVGAIGRRALRDGLVVRKDSYWKIVA